MPAICVGVEGVYKILTNLQIHKATGPDNIPFRIMKETAKEIAPMLQLFFQAFLDQGQLPKEWKTANVVPIAAPCDTWMCTKYSMMLNMASANEDPARVSSS